LGSKPSPTTKKKDALKTKHPGMKTLGYKPSPTTKKKDALKIEHPGMKTLDSESRSGKKSWAQTEMVL
jgi:hypothetical protein